MGKRIEFFLEEVTTCRTADGRVNPLAMKSLLHKLVEIDNTNDAWSKFTADALGVLSVRLEEVENGRATGWSGASVYLVQGASGVVVAVMKIFPKLEELVRELSSLARLRSCEFTQFTIPYPLGVAKINNSNDAGILVSTVARGKSIADLIADVGKSSTESDRRNALTQLKDASKAVARALAQLHTQPTGSGGCLSNSCLSVQIDQARKLAKEFAAESWTYQESTQLDTNKVQYQLENLVQKCLNDCSSSALVHGDAHPGNIFWDSDAGVTLIDTPTLHFSMDSEGKPIGAPERDIAIFYQRIGHFGRRANVSENETQMVQEIFLSAYDYYGGATRSAKKLRMFGARYVLGDLLLTGKEYMRSSVSLSNLQAEIVALKQILEFDNT